MGREMSAEELAAVRAIVAIGFVTSDGESRADVEEDRALLLEHVDAITAQRDDARAQLRALVDAASGLVQHLEGDTDSCRQCGALHPTAHYPACPVGNLAAALRGEGASVADPSARRGGE